MASEFDYLRALYPKVVTSDQVRQMLHISKRKCAWMLQNGFIRCQDNCKKTRRYTIYLEDVIAYAEDSAKHPEKYALPAHYGLRRSEVLGLKWSAIDFEGDMIHVRHKVLGTPKGPMGYDVMKTVSSHRALGLSPAIKALLLAEREKQQERAKVLGNAYCRKDADYVCLNALGELFTPDYVSNRFATILRQNDLKHIRFHDLRHSCASLLVAQGVQMKLIQQWLGHSNISTTANIYSHVDAASTFQCAMTIDEVLGEGK